MVGFMKMISSTKQDMDKVFELNEGVEPKYLTSEMVKKD